MGDMKQVLVIQSRVRQEMIDAEREEYRRSAGEGVALSFASTLDVARDWENPAGILEGVDGVILGGSGEFDLHGGRSEDDPARLTSREIVARIKTFVLYLIENDLPLLGVCYGHQLVAEMHGGNVTNDHSQKKVGTFDVHLTEEGARDPLFSRLPKDFAAQYGHKDSVTTMPHGATLLAVGESCRFSALRYGTRIYTTQFHPELRAEDVAWKLANSPGYLPEGVSVESLVRDSSEASRLIPLFVERVIGVD